MILTIKEVSKRVQSLMDDDTGSVFTSDYLMPIINQRFDDIADELTSLELSFQEQVAVLTVTAGTTDLSTFLNTGGALQALYEPTFMEWRLTTDPDTSYQEVPKHDRLPDGNAATDVGIGGYEWRGGDIYIMPSSVDVSLRVRFQAMTTELVDESDKVMRGLTNVLAYKVAEVIAAKRGGDGGTKLALRYQGMGADALDTLTSVGVKNAQIQNRRFGRTFRRSGQRQYVPRA